MTVLIQRGLEIVPGYTLVRRVGSGMAGEVWVARASGGVHVAIKIIRDMDMVGSKRELGALRIVREVKHTNLCPLIGVWFFDRDGELLSNSATDEILGRESSLIDTAFVKGSFGEDDLRSTPSMIFDKDDSSFAETSELSAQGSGLARGNQTEHDDSSEIDSLGGARQMVVAMGLGDRTLYDRLIEMRAPGNMPDEGDPLHLPGGIPAKELLQYIAGSASAIDELNLNHNIYHCDIKPQNILVVGGNAQVCDFGLARRVQENRRTQLAIGTPAYGAPEMLFDQTYTKTIDQYSLAITYYELRTGKLPFETTRRSMFLRAKAQGELQLDALSPAEQEVIAKATHLEPELRYCSCTAFAEALTEAVYAKPKVKRGYAKWSIVAASGLAVVGTVAAIYLKEPEATASVQPQPKVLQVQPDERAEEVVSTKINEPEGLPDLETIASESIDPPTEMVPKSDVELNEPPERIVPKPKAMIPAKPQAKPKPAPKPEPTLDDHIAQATSLAQQLIDNEGSANNSDAPLSSDLLAQRRSLMKSLDMVFGKTQKTGWELIDDSVRPLAITVAGQIHWDENRISDGLKNWISIQESPNLLTAVPAARRHRVADQTIAWLIGNSKVNNQNITEHRYAKLTVRANGVLRLAAKFAADSKELSRRIDIEKLLVASAEGNTLDGLRLWRLLNLSRSDGFPQLGYSLTHLTSARLTEAKQRSERIELINLNLLASNLQRDVFSKTPGNAGEASVRWQNLERSFGFFTEVLQPKLDRLSTWDTGIDSTELAMFTEDYVDHARVSVTAVDHDGFIDQLRNIELAAAIAAVHSTKPEIQRSMRLTSAEAFLQQRYEQDDDVPATELIGRLQAYGKLVDSKESTDQFILGRVADQNGFLSRDANDTRRAYDEARSLYDSVVNDRSTPADVRGSAARCRASLLTRIAAIADAKDKEELLRAADEDALLALSLPQRWHLDADDRLTTAAEVSLSMVRLLDGLSLIEKQDLLDDADQYLRQAIAERQKRGFPSFPQAILRLNGYLLDLIKLPAGDRHRQKEILARNWITEIATQRVSKGDAGSDPLVKQTIECQSSRLRCHWHCMCSMVLSEIKEPIAAMNEIKFAHQIAVDKLEPSDDRRHFATLILVQLKSIPLIQSVTQKQRPDPRLINELNQLLESIVDPMPDFREKKELYQKELATLLK